jgi:hypothetical protein
VKIAVDFSSSKDKSQKIYTSTLSNEHVRHRLARPEKGGEFIGIRFNLTNIKIFRVDIVISTQVEIGKTRNCVEEFSHNFEFSQFPRVLIYNCLSIRKNVLYFFYNIAQRNLKKEIFRVDIKLCQHGS